MRVIGEGFQNVALKVLQVVQKDPLVCEDPEAVRWPYGGCACSLMVRDTLTEPCDQKAKALKKIWARSVSELQQQTQLVSRTCPEPELLPYDSHPNNLLPAPISHVERQSWWFVMAHSQPGRGEEGLLTPSTA